LRPEAALGISNALFRQEVKYYWARELSSIRSAASDRGIIGPFLGPRRYVSGRFGVSGERGPRERVGSGAEPHESGIGADQAFGIQQAEAGKDLGNHGRIFDGGNDRQGTTALGAG
jgi:hypothetical protein